MSNHSSPFPSSFRPSSTAAAALPPPPPPPPAATTSANPNLTTSLYQTELGLFSLTWSRTFLSGHSLRLHLLPTATAYGGGSPLSLSNPPSLSTLSFHLHIKPFTFWKKNGSKKVHFKNQESNLSPKVQIFWDLSKVKFGFGPEPECQFFIAVVVDREIVLLVGDLTKLALSKARARMPEKTHQVLVLRREHIYSDRFFSTKATFGDKSRDISVDCTTNGDATLIFGVDGKRVLSIKRLKWKFRGNEKIEVDGVSILISWDVYNWLFEDSKNGHAIFVFQFEDNEMRDEESETFSDGLKATKDEGIASWQQRSLIKATRSSSLSSISMSPGSSVSGSSSIMEWASNEDNELSATNGFSLVVYAWRK